MDGGGLAPKIKRSQPSAVPVGAAAGCDLLRDALIYQA